MRRRLPHWIELVEDDHAQLEELVGSGRTEQRVARRARILLAMSQPETVVQHLADQVAQTRATIWALCRRYDEVGIDAVFDAPRSGRPRELSPPGASTDRAAGLLRSRRDRLAYDALVDAFPGTHRSEA